MKLLLALVAALSFFAIAGGAVAATPPLTVGQGGTGWNAVQAGGILYGNSALRLATTTQGTGGFVLSWLNGIPSWTATTTYSNGLTWAAGAVQNTLTAGDGLTRTLADIDCDTANTSTFGCLTDTDWDTFNNKQGAISLTTLGSSGAATFDGTTLNIPEYAGGAGDSPYEIATTSTIAVPQLAYFTQASGRTTLGGIATTTLSGNSQVAVSNTPVLLGASPAVLSIVADSIGDTQLAFNTGQALTTVSNPTFAALTVDTLDTGQGANELYDMDQNVLQASTPTFGGLTLTPLTSALLVTNGSGVLAEYAGSSCTNQFVRSLSALGVATCATVANTDLANSTVSYGGVTLSLGGSDATPAFALADATGLPISTGVSGLGTGVATALGVNTGSAGAVVLFNGALGTPSSGTLTNATGLPIDAGTIGTLPIARGGTATTTAYDTGLFYYDSTLGSFSQASRANSNHNLVWDRVTPGLGIGTTSPWGLLSVNGNGVVGPQFVVGSSTVTNFIVGMNGRVGVATTSPSSNFAFGVTGNGYFSTGITLGTALTVANGGTGLSTCTNNRLITGNGTSAFVCEANATFDGTTLTISGMTGTGVHDLGGATSFELPNGTAPTVDTDGECAIDTTSGQLKCDLGTNVRVIGNGSFYPSFTYATSTAWAGTTTIPLGPAYVAETWNGVKCFTDTGTLQVSFNDATNRMNWMNASTTVGTVVLSTNNTFTASEKRYVDVGTPASSPTKISCTVDKSITAD